MEKLNEMLRSSGLEYFGNGKHKINMENTMMLYKEKKVVVLDVRSQEEHDYVSFGFAKHIPLHELPDRLSELSNDKLIVAFCTTANRSAMAFTYLSAMGYDARILADSISGMAGYFKPGYVLKHHESDFKG